MTPEVTKIDYGLYFFDEDDDATSVARRVYGDPHKSVIILKANPGDWADQSRLVVPNKKGRITLMMEGESVQQCIARMFPNQPVSIFLAPFFKWNGGEDLPPGPGELVFVPER